MPYHYIFIDLQLWYLEKHFKYCLWRIYVSINYATIGRDNGFLIIINVICIRSKMYIKEKLAGQENSQENKMSWDF